MNKIVQQNVKLTITAAS